MDGIPEVETQSGARNQKRPPCCPIVVMTFYEPHRAWPAVMVHQGQATFAYFYLRGLSELHMGVLRYEGYGVAICGASYDCQMPHSVRPVHLRAFWEPLRANPH